MLEAKILDEETLAQAEELNMLAGQLANQAEFDRAKQEREAKLLQMMAEKKRRAAKQIQLKGVEV